MCIIPQVIRAYIRNGYINIKAYYSWRSVPVLIKYRILERIPIPLLTFLQLD